MIQKKYLNIDKTVEAEKILIDIANNIYTNIDLKPMSKSIFFLSRALLVITFNEINDYKDLAREYKTFKLKKKNFSLTDDYNFEQIISQNKNRLDEVINQLNYIKSLNLKEDLCGLIFNSLLRGKFEAGEGLGTFLTPEEVVDPIVEMLIALYFEHNKNIDGYLGDIAGGTGRFLYSLKKQLDEKKILTKEYTNKNFFLFDQSSMSVSLAKINFLLEKTYPKFNVVDDSITSNEVQKLKGKFSFLATNPPFGSNKYKFNNLIPNFFDEKVLNKLNFSNFNKKIDPAELFLFKNFELLKENGVLGIVLPDGIAQTNRIDNIIEAYSLVSETKINKVALVSLPSHTFSLTGTVAQSSFVIFLKSTKTSINLFKVKVEHIGYLKKGNFKIIDNKGNELNSIVEKFKKFIKYDLFKKDIKTKKKFNYKTLKKLKDYSEIPTSFKSDSNLKNVHISILDIDKTGLIDIIQCLENNPSTKPKQCSPNDIIVSCINPRKWRVALVPNLNFNFSCSPEFVVIRVKNNIRAQMLAFVLQSEFVKNQAVEMGVGTSSSRQRVPKLKIFEVFLPKINILEKKVISFYNVRDELYKIRLRENDLLKTIN